MLDDLRRFSTEAFPDDLRTAAWAEVLAKVLVCSARACLPGTAAGGLRVGAQLRARLGVRAV